MVFDGFTFFNEIELLELRLQTMDKFVDRFIIVESKKTFTNNDKPLYYEENREKFKQYWKKIKYIVIDEFPKECKTAWEREYYQRNAIYNGIEGAKDSDILIVSDLDEIISPYGVKRIKHILKKSPEKILKLELLNSWYFLNYVDQKNFFLAAPVAYTIGEAEKFHKECQGTYQLSTEGKIMPQTARAWCNIELVQCAGWHFSYIGGIERIRKKIMAFSHQEYNTEKFLEDNKVQEMIENGEDLFGREIADFVSVPVNYLMPEPVRKSQEKYRSWLCDYRPISKKNRIRLKIKYLVETTILRSAFHKIKGLKSHK